MLDTVLGLVGVGLDLFGQKSEADARQAAAGDNAARYAKEAEYQQYRTGVQLDELEDYKNSVIANQRVAFAKAGIVIDRNTALDVNEATARQYEKDKLAIETEGRFNVERAQMGAASSLSAGRDIRTASYFDMGRTILNTDWGKIF